MFEVKINIKNRGLFITKLIHLVCIPVVTKFEDRYIDYLHKTA